jgi:predicted transporter
MTPTPLCMDTVACSCTSASASASASAIHIGIDSHRATVISKRRTWL